MTERPKISEFNRFIRDYAVPVLGPAGFRRVRHEFLFESEDGGREVLRFHAKPYPEELNFVIQYGAFPPAWRRWHAFIELPEEPVPAATNGLIFAQCFAPVSELRQPVLPYEWYFPVDGEERDQLGRYLADVLRDQVLSNFQAWRDPECLLQAVTEHRPGFFTLLASPTAARLVALIQGGHFEQAVDLSALDSDDGDKWRAWVLKEAAGAS